MSHWGAYALLGALAVVRADWRQRLLRCLDEALDRRILEATLRDGPAVDGVSRVQARDDRQFRPRAFITRSCARSARLAEGGHAAISEFVFESYRYDPADASLSLRYRFLDGPRFEERLVFDFPPQPLAADAEMCSTGFSG